MSVYFSPPSLTPSSAICARSSSRSLFSHPQASLPASSPATVTSRPSAFPTSVVARTPGTARYLGVIFAPDWTWMLLGFLQTIAQRVCWRTILEEVFAGLDLNVRPSGGICWRGVLS